MENSNSKSEKPKKLHLSSQEQYDMLKRCSDKKDITEWNQWRKANPNQDILLDKRDFHGWCLQRALLNTGAVVEPPGGPDHQWVFKGEVYLRGSLFLQTALQGTNFRGAHLQEAMLNSAQLDEACLELTHIEGTHFKEATFDKWTSFEGCQIDKRTDFRGADLESLRVSPWIKQLMEYNIRRKNWEDWYPKQGRLFGWIVRKFWQISDYGISTKGIIKTFLKWAFYFAVVYYAWGCIDYYLLSNKDYPGIVSNLFALEDNQQPVSGWLVPFRAVYFSIVTMTTLGFGDMYANAHSLIRGIFGHILLALQVILGYVLLGALVTRFAVLFTAGGPAGKFADEKEKEDKKE